jgi:hypothetical protein
MSDSRLPSARRQLCAAWAALALIAATILPSCAQPYRGPRTLAAVAVGVLAGSAAVWVAGERADQRTLANLGAAGTALGTAAAGTAGVWIAASAGCRVDPDCPEDEVCREIPAPPDREPFRQCSPR